MKAMVRDDIIGLESYVDAEFKYRFFIEAISECGGYCFIEQIDRIYSDSGGRYLVQKMEDAKLVKTDYFSKYKYIRLTASALKYLRYRDDERDFSDIPKNEISVQNLKTNPSEKVLFTSVLNFEHYSFSNYYNFYFSKKKHLDYLEEVLKVDNNLEIEKLQLKISKLKEDYFEHKFAVTNQVTICNRLKEQNQEMENKIKSLTQEKELLLQKNNFLKSYDGDIDRIEGYISCFNKIIESNNSDLRSMYSIEQEMNSIGFEHNSTEKEIEKLRNEQEKKSKVANEIIHKLMKLRDVSKLICVLQPEGEEDGCFYEKTIHIISTFVKYHKSNYLETIKDTIGFMDDHNFKIRRIKLDLVSIFKPSEQMYTQIKKIENYYKDSRIDFSWKYTKTDHLEKYFDTVQDNIGYIKEDHIEQFANLRDKLSKK